MTAKKDNTHTHTQSNKRQAAQHRHEAVIGSAFPGIIISLLPHLQNGDVETRLMGLF